MSETKGNGADKIQCPACERPSSVRELGDHHGVCQFCQKAFRLSNRTWLEAKPPQETHEETPRTDEHKIEHEREVVWFNHAEVDEMLGDITAQPEDVLTKAGDLLGRILLWCWTAGTIRAAYARFGIITRGLRPDLVPMNFRQLARALNCKKQNVSKACGEAEVFWGVRFRNLRSESGKARMRMARLRNPVGRNGGRKARTPLPL